MQVVVDIEIDSESVVETEVGAWVHTDIEIESFVEIKAAAEVEAEWRSRWGGGVGKRGVWLSVWWGLALRRRLQ